MDFTEFVFTVILITLSGALAPGPMFVTALSHGAKSGARSGLIFSIGHSIVEFSLVMLLAMGLLTVAEIPLVKLVIGVLGGFFLLFFGLIQIYDSLNAGRNEIDRENVKNGKLFFIGLAISGLNPFFIIWWLTIGSNLILLSIEFASLFGVVLMYLCHVWIDYVWLIFITHLSKIGANIMGSRLYRILMITFGLILIYFGFDFLIDTLL